MKKNLITHIFALLIALPTMAGTIISQFDMQHYTGWVYSRSTIEVNSNTISTNRISLYTASNGDSYTLCSPRFNPMGATSVSIASTIISPNVGENNFNLAVAYPNFELIDDNDNVLARRDYYLSTEQLINNLNVTLDVPSGVNSVRVRLAARQADINSFISVRKVIVEQGSEHIKGDVNTDGTVDVSDVTTLVNMILGITPMTLTVADLTGEGNIDVTDVTTLINIILNKEE